MNSKIHVHVFDHMYLIDHMYMPVINHNRVHMINRIESDQLGDQIGEHTTILSKLRKVTELMSAKMFEYIDASISMCLR